MTRRLYTLALFALLPFTLLYLLWRARRQPAYRQHWNERLGRYAKEAPQVPRIWIHAISVGETRAAQPLVTALKQRFPEHTILLTHMTPTGRETGAELFGDTIEQSYLPYDFPFAANAFLSHYRPRIGMLMETEIWPNLIHAAKQHGIPLLLVNARLSAKSARRYRRVANLTRDALLGLHRIAAQSEADRQALLGLGAADVVVTGNLKFDVEPSPQALAAGAALRHAIGNRPVWVAASTREGEEELLLSALRRLEIENALMILVPRHPQRFDEVAGLLERHGMRFQRRSSSQSIELSTSVLLGDSMGELNTYYAASDVAFVGGSLKPFGGQNLIEPCALGKPVLFGPHTYNFAAAAQAAQDAGAAIQVRDAPELMDALRRLLRDEALRARMGAAALQFASLHRGATEKTMALIEQALHDNGTESGRSHGQ